MQKWLNRSRCCWVHGLGWAHITPCQGERTGLVCPTTLWHELCKNGWTNRDAISAVDSGGPKEACTRLLGAAHTGATCRIPQNHPCATVTQPFVKLLWPLVVIIIIILTTDTLDALKTWQSDVAPFGVEVRCCSARIIVRIHTQRDATTSGTLQRPLQLVQDSLHLGRSTRVYLRHDDECRNAECNGKAQVLFACTSCHQSTRQKCSHKLWQKTNQLIP